MSTNTRKFTLYFFKLLFFWTSLVVLFCYSQYQEYKSSIVQVATKEANLTFLKDSLYRKWVSQHGGVYVPVSDITPPNPYLSHVSNRDVVTIDGQKLTLVNPAYMTRQVFEMAEHDVVQGHLTSDKLMNPINAPDPWEVRALKEIMSGKKQFSEIDSIHGEPYLRFMRPFMTSEGCLKCHADQGYEVGDIRGGISVEVPLKDYYSAFGMKSETLVVMSFLIWLFGALSLFFSTSRMKKLMVVEEKVNHEKGIVLKELNHRIKNNLQIISSIIDIHVDSENDDKNVDTLLDIQSRLYTMAEMHNMFESQNHITGVNSQGYICKIVNNFMKTHQNNIADNIDISCDVESVNLSGTRAVSCGLILNELLTNSYKYAFNDSIEKPSISVSMSVQNGEANLVYTDNGVGFDYDAVKSEGFGLMIIDSMADKMKSHYEINSSDGVSAWFRFKINDEY